MNSFKTFNGKKIILSGHTGFKGSWLSAWLSHLGANVIGLNKKTIAHNNTFLDSNSKFN